jgi:hypothetical protein
LWNYVDCTEAQEREWSPVWHLPQAGACPAWLVAYGAEEDLRGIPAQTMEMQAAAVARGCESELVVAPKGHAIAYFGKVKAQVIAFLLRH